MRDKRALQKIREEFHRFSTPKPQGFGRHWTMIPRDKNELLAHALRYLCEFMQVDRAAVFLYDEARQTLVARQLVDRADVLPRAEEIAIMPEPPLARLLAGKRAYLLIDEGAHNIAYIALRAFGNIFGVLRVETLRGQRPFTEKSIPLLNDFAHELATAMHGMELAATEREQVAQMRALHEVSNAIFRSLRLDEMIKSVAQSLIQQLGFDRVRLYLVNRDGEHLESVLTMDQRGHQIIEKERFPLKLSTRLVTQNALKENSTMFTVAAVMRAAGFTFGDIRKWGGEIHLAPRPSDPARRATIESGTVNAIFDEGIKSWAGTALDHGFNFLPVEGAVLKRLVAMGYRPAVMPKSRFHGMAEDITTIDFSGWPMIVRAEMPDNVAYAICEAIDKRKEFIPTDNYKPLDIAQLCANDEEAPYDVPLHPGA